MFQWLSSAGSTAGSAAMTGLNVGSAAVSLANLSVMGTLFGWRLTKAGWGWLRGTPRPITNTALLRIIGTRLEEQKGQIQLSTGLAAGGAGLGLWNLLRPRATKIVERPIHYPMPFPAQQASLPQTIERHHYHAAPQKTEPLATVPSGGMRI